MFDHYHEYESLLATIQVVLVMVGMGATLSLADFLTVTREPRSLFVGCLCQFLFAPLATLATVMLFSLDPGIVVGLILISAMPGGPVASLYTFLARGNVALSITLTVVATFASILTVPALLRIFAHGYVPGDVAMPVDVIVGDVALYLIAPLALGMIVARLAPGWAGAVSAWLTRAGMIILAAIVVGSLGSGRIDPVGYGWTTPLVIIGLCLVIQNVSMALFAIFRWSVADQTAVGIGVTIRNINLALLLAARLFPASSESASDPSMGGGVLYVALFWGALSLIVCIPSIFVQRRALAAETVHVANG